MICVPDLGQPHINCLAVRSGSGCTRLLKSGLHHSEFTAQVVQGSRLQYYHGNHHCMQLYTQQCAMP